MNQIKRIFAVALAVAVSHASAQQSPLTVGGYAGVVPSTCAPSPIGTGSRALYAWPSKGAFVAWWCPGEPLPTMYVCTRAVCSLVGAQRAVAALLTRPTLQGLNEAAKSTPRSQWSDPELIEVWLPHWADIKALRK